MDEEDFQDLEADVTTMQCAICGECEYTPREGFYYCNECGTAQNVRVITVDQDVENTKFARKQKIKTTKSEKLDLTSWECYNYILRGFVEELLSFGAKEELKLTALQLWAAYLRRNEVAFFNKRHTELPRLGVRYLQKDATALYNHSMKQRAKRKRRQNDDASGKKRQHRKNVRNLDASIYSMESQTDNSTDWNTSCSSGNTISSGSTGRAIQLRFSSTARRFYKKSMAPKHLERHAKDAEGSLKCHNLKTNTKSLKWREYITEKLNLKQIYGILAIALNLIEDDIQLSDLGRYIAEGHISAKQVVAYFPPNLAADCRTLLNDIKFYSPSDEFTRKNMGIQMHAFASSISLKFFKVPDIWKLAQRYITELCLPDGLATIVARLINFLPPKMATRAPSTYPAFEARAMAYIIFVLKLLFGLDGDKEQRISQSAQNMNLKLRPMQLEDTAQPPLFVWSEWVEYIEMRKVIISQHSYSFAKQHQEPVTSALMLGELRKQRQRQQEQYELFQIKPNAVNNKVENMQGIFAKLAQKLPASPTAEILNFKPSLTPAHSYLKCILQHNSDKEGSNTKQTYVVPEYMRIEHGERTIWPFVDAKPLRCYLATNGVRLRTSRLSCQENRTFVGVFRAPVMKLLGSAHQLRLEQVDFDIDEEHWREQCMGQKTTFDDLEFKTNMDTYETRYMQKLQRCKAEREKSIYRQPPGSQQPPQPSNMAIHSSDVFMENNMNPLPNCDELKAPRRGLGSVNIFADLSDSDSDSDDVEIMPNSQQEFLSNSSADSSFQNEDSILLHTSAMDYWLLLGGFSHLLEVHKKELASRFPLSFRWLLETCARTIGVDWSDVFEQLLTIETMFAYGVENMSEFTDCLYLKYFMPNKDLNQLVNQYREIW